MRRHWALREHGRLTVDFAKSVCLDRGAWDVMTDQQENNEHYRQLSSTAFSEPNLVPLQPATSKDPPLSTGNRGLLRGAQRLFKGNSLTVDT